MTKIKLKTKPIKLTGLLELTRKIEQTDISHKTKTQKNLELPRQSLFGCSIIVFKQSFLPSEN